MIDPNSASDLREVYLQVFDSFSLHSPTEISDRHGSDINTRYARELLGVLVNQGLLYKELDEDGEDFWQVLNPGTYDDHTRAEAEKVIDGWLDSLNINRIRTDKKETNMKQKQNQKQKNDTYHPCYCGCGTMVPSKSFYRPGHDARHAGQVGRAIASATDGDPNTLLDVLPSDRLKIKAEGIAAKAREKQARLDAKARADQGNREEGTIKVGKKEYAATRLDDGSITYFVGTEERTASKTAAKTFQA